MKVSKKGKNKSERVGMYMSKLVFKADKSVDASELVSLLVGMPDMASQVIKGLKDAGVKSPKAEKEIVAVRVQTKDTPATAKKQRKAGEEFALTEQALTLTLKTWIKGANAEKDIEQALADLEAGKELEFASFKLVGIA